MNGYITLDYELAMGRKTGTPEKCLIEPMNYLTAMVDKYGIKMNVFVDAAYLLQLRKLKSHHPQLQKDWDTVTNHIRLLDAKGHSIQLHLHPQWCYSTYDGEKWQLDMDHYKLSDLSLDNQKQLIQNGVQLLNELISKKVTAFRAGGYSIENFPQLFDTFLQVGIIIDSSVFRGEHTKGKYQTYDYRKVPNKTSYYFSSSNKIEDEKGEMKEYPLSTIVVPSILYLINKKNKHSEYKYITSSKKKWGDGVGIGYPGNKFHIFIHKLLMLIGNKSICTYIEEGVNIEKIYNYSCDHYEGDEFVIIGHPKAMSPFSIDVFEAFLKEHLDIEFRIF